MSDVMEWLSSPYFIACLAVLNAVIAATNLLVVRAIRRLARNSERYYGG